MVSYPPPFSSNSQTPSPARRRQHPSTHNTPPRSSSNQPSTKARWHPSPPSARPSRRPWAYAAEHNIRSTSTCRNETGGLVRMRIQASGFTRVPRSSLPRCQHNHIQVHQCVQAKLWIYFPQLLPNTVHYYTTPTALPFPGGFLLFFLSSMAMQSSPASNISQTKSIAINK